MLITISCFRRILVPIADFFVSGTNKIKCFRRMLVPIADFFVSGTNGLPQSLGVVYIHEYVHVYMFAYVYMCMCIICMNTYLNIYIMYI